MKNNIIKRTSNYLKVRFLESNSAYKKNDIVEIRKNDLNYWSDGKYRFCIAHLRNNNLCEILEQKQEV